MLRKTVKILLPVLLAAVFFSSMFTLKVGAESQSEKTQSLYILFLSV